MALTVQLAPQSEGEASTIGPWQEFPTGISGGIRICWNSELVLFMCQLFLRKLHHIGLIWLGRVRLRALLAGSLVELPEPISGAIRYSQRERVAVLAGKLDSHSTISDQLYTDSACSAFAGSDGCC